MPAPFEHVHDSRNHVIRGLWKQGQRYYAQMRFEGDKSARKVPLVNLDASPCRTAAQAQQAQHRLKEKRTQGQEPPAARIAPAFDEYVEHYLEHVRATDKTPATAKNEQYTLAGWTRTFGTLRLNRITKAMILAARDARKREGKSNSTVNGELIVLRNLLRFAVSEGHLPEEHLPTNGIKTYRIVVHAKGLLPPDTVDRICAEALRRANPETESLLRQVMAYRATQSGWGKAKVGQVDWQRAWAEHPDWRGKLGATTRAGRQRLYALVCLHRDEPGYDGERWVYRNGRMFVDWIKFMAYSGSRRTAALQARWEHVNFDQNLIHLFTKGRGGNKEVIAPMLDQLKAHLHDMASRRTPGPDGALSPLLFPSPRGDTAAACTSLDNTLAAVREALGLPEFHAHYLRHLWASDAVMSGMDFMTIARVLGHNDGGILVAKRYGHLRNEHVKEQLEKMNRYRREKNQPAPPIQPIQPAAPLSGVEKELAEIKALLQAQQARPAPVLRVLPDPAP